MADQIDQLMEAQFRLGQNSDTRITHAFTFVYQLKGKWYDGTAEGNFSDCGAALEEDIAKHGGDLSKVRWARGYMDGTKPVIHPKTDAVAEAQLRKVMERNARKQPRRR